MKARRELHEKALLLLKNHPAFFAAEQKDIRCVIAGENATLKEVAKAQPISPAHSQKKSAGLILTGSCHLLTDGKITAVEKPGFVFGLESLYSEIPAPYIKAAEGCKVVYLKKQAVDEIIGSNPAAKKCFEVYLAQSTAQPQPVSQNAAEEKLLAKYLLNKQQNAAGQIQLPQDMVKLAKQLGLSRDKLFKAMEGLHAAGAIALKGAAICINRTELEKFNTD